MKNKEIQQKLKKLIEKILILIMLLVLIIGLPIVIIVQSFMWICNGDGLIETIIEPYQMIINTYNDV